MASAVEIVSGMALLALFAAGCSSGGDDPAPSGASCETACASSASAGCASDLPQAECVGECQTQIAPLTCGSEYLALVACGYERGTVHCGAEGSEIQEDPREICPDESRAIASCAMCEPTSADSSLVLCMKGECCAEMRSVTQIPGYLDWTRCRDECLDEEACGDACDAAHPDVEQGAETVAVCALSRCST
jgi:hypothetical protein